tara:strand:- start:12419 stop:14485 length:2067 start_codon:yes stop_codon:yes gene_type:complete
MGYKEKKSYFNLIKESVNSASNLKKKKGGNNTYNQKYEKAKIIISNIQDSEIKKVFEKKLNEIQQSGGAEDINLGNVTNLASKASDFRESTLGQIAEKVVSATPVGKMALMAGDKIASNIGSYVEQGKEIAKSVGIDADAVQNISNKGVEALASGAVSALKTSNELGNSIKDAENKDESNDSSTKEVKDEGHNINVEINVGGKKISDGNNPDLKTPDVSVTSPIPDEAVDTTVPVTDTASAPAPVPDAAAAAVLDDLPASASPVEPTIDTDGSAPVNLQQSTPLEEKNKKEQSPSYPKELQIIPLDSHSMNKLSPKFNAYLGNLKNKIDLASQVAASQNELIIKKQAQIDKDRLQIKKSLAKSQQETEKTANKQMNEGRKAFIRFCNGIWNFIKACFNAIYRILDIFVELCKSHPVALICWIIAIIIFFVLLAWFVFGLQINVGDDNKKSPEPKDQNDGKEASSQTYGSGGTPTKFSFKKCFENPLSYTFDFCSSRSKQIKSPAILNKLYNNISNNSSSILKQVTGISLIEKYKTDRPQNKAEDDITLLDRVDNISYIDYNLLNNNIKQNIYGTTDDNDNDKYSALSILKPKNIEWNFPYIDYSSNTDANKLPEVIKNYKNKKDPTDYSLNDTRTLIFPWDKVGRQYVLNCNAKFKDLDPNISSDLYLPYNDDNSYCVTNSKNNPVIN